MKKLFNAFAHSASTKVCGAANYLFGRGQIRSTLIAAAIAFATPAAHAVDLSDLGNAASMICLIQAYVSGPVLFCIGIVVIIMAAIMIANSESNIVKFLATVFIGLGVAACAIPIVKNRMHIDYTCA
ncbi:conserved hypothetical protein (plasmid) [Burkholderia ambifaria MC40-6]|jgi:type IV secretory pathway VirB2 component (pilin)|uniref:Conjugal transfer protein TrbC n=1 Tax=Burkholderia ambifaria (strain MC40-6) TaxID=398577 RepID=B1Z656_BURA4|nr:TrbC/VirB2 family protein [Burkholderia ambifaria]ACB68933.1 conserved hypothetical protein [Burkholderia ambifaria MC40-6]